MINRKMGGGNDVHYTNFSLDIPDVSKLTSGKPLADSRGAQKKGAM